MGASQAFNRAAALRVELARRDRMKKPLCTVLAVASLLVAAAPSFAEGAEGEDASVRIAKRVEAAFARLDADKDGRISRAEAANGKRLARKFDKVDADHDGYVTRAELTAALERRAQR